MFLIGFFIQLYIYIFFFLRASVKVFQAWTRYFQGTNNSLDAIYFVNTAIVYITDVGLWTQLFI